MSQEEGIIGRIVGQMIRNSVRRRYRNVYWRLAETKPLAPTIFYANHHGWMDGYLLFHLAQKLEIRCIDWIEEFDSFPLFDRVGGMRYAPGDTQGRVATVRKSIRLMQEDQRSLVIFPEGILHRPPDILPFGKAIQVVAGKVKQAKLTPVAIMQEMSLHERPEAWISVGEPHEFLSLENCHLRLESELIQLKTAVTQRHSFEILARGTASVNERMNMRKFGKSQ